MPITFDKEQEKAINETGKNILVSASAGAGKTGVLVARLVKRCVQDRIPITRILAVTFTQAAAEEMKKRLAKKLNEAYNSETNAEKRAYLKQQLLSLGGADITTIDSYCKTIIEKYCNVIQLDPATANHVLSESEIEQYQQKAWNAVCAEFSEKDSRAFQKLLLFSTTRPEDTQSLFSACKTIAAHADNACDPNEWLDQAFLVAKPVACMHDFSESVLQSFFDYFLLQLEVIRSDLETMEENKDQCKNFNTDSLTQKEICLENCRKNLQDENYSLFCDSLKNLALEYTPSGDEANSVYSKTRKHMSDTIKKMLENCYDEKTLVQDHNAVSLILQALICMTKQYRALFINMKKKDGCIDFTDMERYALDILNANGGEIADIIREQLDEIMVDEFQDTSNLQHMIITRIAKKNNVFRVGDIKQSIYKFRQAKPELMRSLMDNQNNLHITLLHNYRAKESLVRFTNDLFSTCMNVPGLKNRYDVNDHVSIGQTNGFSSQKEDTIVPVIFADVAESSEDENMEEESAPNKALKSRWIASTIRQEMEKNPELHFRDFAVLTRGHADKTFLRSAFEHYTIPYAIDAREGFYQSRMAQTIHGFVHFLMNDHDTVSLLTVLTSSMYNFTDEELAHMKIEGGSLLEGLKEFHPEILTELRDLRIFAREHGVQAFLSRLAAMHDFIEHQNEQERANYDALFQAVCTSSITTLQQFMTMLDTSQDEKTSQALSTVDDDVVTVTTIHASKGLEYPYVFLWSTNKNTLKETDDMIIVDDDFYVGAKWLNAEYGAFRPTLRFTAIKHKTNLEDLEEFIRLLYVAVTRAQKRLYIVDALPENFIQNNARLSLSSVSRRKGMSGILLPALSDKSKFFKFVETPAFTDEEEYERPLKKTSSTLVRYTGKPVSPYTIATPSGFETTSLPPLTDQKKTNGSAYGTFMHETIARLPNRLWKKEDFDNLPIQNNDMEKILAFGQSSLYQEALHMDIHKEFPIYVEDQNTYTFGIMDFVAISENKIILIDFKTDSENADVLRKRYQRQLNAYRDALQKSYALPIEAYLWSFHNSIAIPMP